MKEPKSLQNEESSKEAREEIQDGKTPSPSKQMKNPPKTGTGGTNQVPKV
jgi:hypothetical protein